MADIKEAPTTRDAAPPCLAWEDIRKPGAYVDVTTGKLYRISQDSLVKEAVGASKPDLRGGQLVQLSPDPWIFPLGARLLCARHHIAPDF